MQKKKVDDLSDLINFDIKELTIHKTRKCLKVRRAEIYSGGQHTAEMLCTHELATGRSQFGKWPLMPKRNSINSYTGSIKKNQVPEKY